MKRITAILLTFLLLLSLVGCGGNDTTNVEKDSGDKTNNKTELTKSETVSNDIDSKQETKALDLTGLWIQEGKNETESHMVATIKEDGTIGVFFILEGDPEPWTYWVGTYEAPKNDDKKYSWVSKNTYGGNGMLASSAETKDFAYDSEKLSYDVTIQGDTSTVYLVRGNWDTSNIPESAFGSVNSSTVDVKDLEIIESDWYISGDYLGYYIVIHNPNDEIAVEYPSFRITARDSSGSVIGTEDQTLSIIYPGQDFYYGSQAFSTDEEPNDVEFEIIPPNDYNLKKVNADKEYKPLEVVDASVRSDKFVGEISNLNDYSIETAIVLAVCKDSSGKVINVFSTFVDNIGAGSKAPFSILLYGDVNTTNVEYYTNQW